MWKAKRKSKRRKNDKKMFECEEFRQERERYKAELERRKREFEEFIEKREKLEKIKEEIRILEGKINNKECGTDENKKDN